ncbi:hypothetical protein [Roseburia hominis]|uniref:hypothetical protein n=1 Tax=Roseburia hominis TaxID=301301 RepID=UPI0026727B49|nr:hypothetical protein [Roseburia hominis]
MAIKPILFNTEMVRAILDGRKSCTRRLVKFLPGENPRWTGYTKDGLMLHNGKNEPCIRKAPYQPGDILYVRETWSPVFVRPRRYLYKVECKEGENLPIKWHPSIHMPKKAARIWLKVTNVRVERLQEMKPVDVIKEGAYPDCWDCLNTYGESGSQCCYGTEEQCSQCDEVMMEWEKLWNSTIKKTDLDSYGWEANPWVWVIEFERCEKPEEIRI